MVSQRRLRKTLCIAALLAFIAIIGAPAAMGQTLQMSAGVTFPSTVIVGQEDLAVSINAKNDSILGGTYSTSIVERLDLMTLQVSCTNNSIPCAVPENPPVFVISSASGTGAAGSACAGVTFTIAPTANPGEYTFTPQSQVLLTLDTTPLDPLESRCIVDFTVDVVNAPATDANLGQPGLQTAQSNQASGVVVGGDNDGQSVSGTGPDLTTVESCSIEITKEVGVRAERRYLYTVRRPVHGLQCLHR